MIVGGVTIVGGGVTTGRTTGTSTVITGPTFVCIIGVTGTTTGMGIGSTIVGFTIGVS